MRNNNVVDSVFSAMGWHPALIYKMGCFNEWKDFVRENFPWLEFKNRSGQQFSAEICSTKIANSSLSLICCPGGEVERTRYLSEISDEGMIKLVWQIEGKLKLTQDRNSCVLHPGLATVCDSARPYHMQMSDNAKFVVLMIPHNHCAGWEHFSMSVCGRILNQGASSRSILGALMALMASGVDEESDDLPIVLDSLRVMVGRLISRTAEQAGLPCFDNPNLDKARDHIVRNLSNNEFGSDELASAMCMSRRSLYMLFEKTGTTPVKLIRDIRLEFAMRILIDKTQRKRKITDIALESGFREYATFTRLFKSKYGKTPSQWRG